MQKMPVQPEPCPRRAVGSRARRAVALAGALAVCATVTGAPPAADPDLGIPDAPVPVERSSVQVTERLGERIPLDLTFTGADGTPVQIGRWFNDGKPVVVLMVYFRCPLMCPQVTNALMKAVSGVDWTIGEQYHVVLVSFDPTEDAAAGRTQQENMLALYDRDATDGIRRGLAVLTDSERAGKNAKALADALGFKYQYMPKSNEYSHMGVTYVLTPDGRIARNLYSLNYTPQTLRMALLEASQGQIGTALDRATLWCMAYDPVTGKYKIMAKRVMQIGGVASAGVVGAIMLGMFVAERRRRRRALPPTAATSININTETPASETKS